MVSHIIIQNQETCIFVLHIIQFLFYMWYVVAGRVAEFDTPARLLEDKSSMFLKLVSEYSSRSSGMPDL